MRIYIDLDETLIGNILDADGNSVGIVLRPGAQWFLRTLANHGSLWLITASAKEHAREGLKKLGREARLFKGVITRETMKPVAEQIEVVLETPGLTDEQRATLWKEIMPIAKPGIVFDDFPPGSSLWALKSKSIGMEDENKWITVDPYFPGSPDQHGLKQAYSEFITRFGDQGRTLGYRVRPLMIG